MISFVNLIQLLSEHQLYISESGLIARYGKTKGVQGGNLSHSQRATLKIKDFFTNNASCAIWFALYFVLNVLMLAIGVGAADLAGRRGWNLVAFGAGPVLSMNCVLVLLPTLSSLIHAMRNSTMMNKVCCDIGVELLLACKQDFMSMHMLEGQHHRAPGLRQP